MAGDSEFVGTDRGWLYSPEFPEEWHHRALYSLAEWVNGLAFRDIQFAPTGKPVIKIAEIKNGISGQTKFTHDTFDPSVYVSKGDMLFSWSGQPETSIDVFWWQGPDGWLNQHVFKVTPSKEVDRVFFYYLLRYLKPNFVGIARNKQTTGLGHVTRRDLERIEVACPPLPEQRAIAHILGTLDDKIELNRRMNETLEAIARALFKSWFVDFDPVRAKAEGLDVGLPDHLADLFPDRLVEPELGEIPEGWRVKPLDEVAHYQNGLAMQKYPPEGDKFLPVVKIRELRQGCVDETSGQASPSIDPSCIIDDGDVVFSWSGSLLIDIWCGGKAALNQHLFKVTSAEYPRWFYYFWTKHYLSDFRQIAAGKATTMGHIQRSHLSDSLVAVPTDEVLHRAGKLIAPLLEAGVNCALQSRTLAAIRDALLPRLLSGEVGVGEAERFVGVGP